MRGVDWLSEMKAILTYHSIDTSGSVISVDPPCFRRHIRWLASTGVAVVSLDQLLHDRDGGHDMVAITFDDAFENFAEHAWPALREQGFPVTLYAPTGHVGGTNAWEANGRHGIPQMKLLGWDSLAGLAEEGVTLGSHGSSHGDLRRMGVADLETELEGSAALLAERTGCRPATFAYPYGYLNDEVAGRVQAVYEAAVTTVLAPVTEPVVRHRLPRIDAYYLRGIENLESWSWRRLLLYLGVRRALRSVRGMLTNA